MTIMTDDLPPSLKRKHAHSVTDRENALLDNFEFVREIEAGCLSNPSVLDLIGSAKGLGLECRRLMTDEESRQHLWGVFHDDTMIAVIHSIKGENSIYPTENRW